MLHYLEMIYFIQETEEPHRIKIGFSETPQKRLRTLAAILPQDFILLKLMEGQIEDERFLHQRWKQYRVLGKREWYYPYPELLDSINSEVAISSTTLCFG